MSPLHAVSRRKFLQSVALASGASVLPGLRNSALALRTVPAVSDSIQSGTLEEFSYGDNRASDSERCTSNNRSRRRLC